MQATTEASRRPPLWQMRALSAVTLMLVSIYSVVATLQIITWNPQSVAPGLSLDEIHEAMDARDQNLHVPHVLRVMGGYFVLGVMGFFASRSPRVARVSSTAMQLGIVALGAPAYLIATFPTWFALEESFAAPLGDHSLWSIPLYAVSAAASLGLVILSVQPFAKRGQLRR